jgi:prevent-host-death family protein
MKEVGAYEAKTRLPSLLREVEAGETIIITRHGKPIARIVPAQIDDKAEVRDAIARIKAARRKRAGISIEEIISSIHEGHRY